MEALFFVLLLMFVATPPTLCVRAKPCLFNVVSYGAKGDGYTDDSQAFEKAWRDVCGATQCTPTLLVPHGRLFMLQPVSFEGPCKSGVINVKIRGIIVAPRSVNAWKWANNNDKDSWVRFGNINGLVINGGGAFNGEGGPWWTHHSNRPTALRFHNCKHLALSRLSHINSPRSHISINSCSDSIISDLHIIAPEDSPNTDGIDISESSNIVIKNSVIETGDDCIAINGGSTFMNITGIACGPGHGISVGSLGRNGAHETVEQIHVKNCTFKGTMNGARIKTWMGGSGYARKIIFEDIILIGAGNPVIIDQQYVGLLSGAPNTAVQVSDVTYRNVKGTSASENAITLRCDHHVGCTDIVLNDIAITSATGGAAQAVCNNVRGTSSSWVLGKSENGKADTPEFALLRNAFTKALTTDEHIAFLTKQWYINVLARIRINAFRIELAGGVYEDLLTSAFASLEAEAAAGNAVYVLPSFYNHEYDPNAHIIWIDNADAKLKALSYIDEGLL